MTLKITQGRQGHRNYRYSAFHNHFLLVVSRNNLASFPRYYHFLANVNSRSRSLYAIARPSVVCLSCLTFVRPTQTVQIFGNISTALGTLAIHWHPLKISRGC